jgi:hypothetical protein
MISAAALTTHSVATALSVRVFGYDQRPVLRQEYNRQLKAAVVRVTRVDADRVSRGRRTLVSGETKVEGLPTIGGKGPETLVGDRTGVEANVRDTGPICAL